MFYTLIAITLAAYLVGSLPISKWGVYGLTFGGRIKVVQYIAFIQVCTDIAKGGVIVWFGYEGGLAGAHCAALAAYIGHIYPLGPNFGKRNGTGTLLGALISLNPLVGLTALSAWLFAFYIYRNAASSVIISAGLTTFICGFLGHGEHVKGEVLLLMFGIVLWRNRRHLMFRM